MPKKQTNLTLSNRALKQARTLKKELMRGSLTNLIEFLIDEKYKKRSSHEY